MRFYNEIDDKALASNDAMNMIQSVAKDGYVQAEFLMAKIFEEGKFGVIQDTAKALSYYEHAAKQGHIDAAYVMGHKYHKDSEGGEGGEGIAQNPNKAREFSKIVVDEAKNNKGIFKYDYTETNVKDAETIYTKITQKSNSRSRLNNKTTSEVVKENEDDDDLIRTAKKAAEDLLERDEGDDDGDGDSESDGDGDGDDAAVSSAAAAVAAAAAATASAESGEIIINPDDIVDISVTSDVPSPATSAVVASSAAASAAASTIIPPVSASVGPGLALGKYRRRPPPHDNSPAPLPPITKNDKQYYQSYIKTIRKGIEDINIHLISYNTKKVTPESKSKQFSEIQDLKQDIEGSIRRIETNNYPRRNIDESSVWTNVQNLHNQLPYVEQIGLYRALWDDLGEDLTQANNDYAALLKEYDKLKPILIDFVRNHDIANGRFVLDHTKGELFFDLGGEGKGTVAYQSSGKAYVGGSHHGGGGNVSTSIQNGGRYHIPHDSKIYRMFATEVGHKPDELKERHPEIYEEVIKGIESGEIKPSEDDESPIKSSNNLKPEAYFTARDSNVVRNMLRGLAQTSVSAMATTTDELIKEYEQLVAMCRPETAVALIKAQLESKNIDLPKEPLSKVKATDNRIRETLGWNNSENRLLYDTNLVRKTSVPTANGVFSKFCYHKGKFSVFMSRGCPGDYSCMLNWVIIFAFRLLTHEPDKYKDENIVELIQNLHKTLFGDIFRGNDFVSRFVSENKNTTFYADSVKKLMSSDIFGDVTLQPLVIGIKREIQAMSEITAIDSIVRNTKKLRGGMKDVVTRKHRHNRVEDTAKHTRKHKIVTISLNKTRRTKT
jgi:hypothetical protein